MLPRVKVVLSPVVSVSLPVRRLAPPLRVSARSARSKPVTGALNTMVIVVTALLRGSGETSVMSTVGAVVSTVTESADEATLTLPARSVAVAVTLLTPSERAEVV